MSNIRKPYKPPTVTKRGNLKFLTQSNLPSTGPQEDPTGDLTGDGVDEIGIDENGDGFIDFVEVSNALDPDGPKGKVEVETTLGLGDVAYYDSWLRESDPVPFPGEGILFDFAEKDGVLYFDKVPGEGNVDQGPTDAIGPADEVDPWDIEDGVDNRETKS